MTEDLKLEETVKESVDKITKYKASGKLIAFIVAALSAGIAIFALAMKLRKQGKELAKLKHEKNLHDEEVRRAAADALLKKDEADKDAALDKAEHHLEVSQAISTQIDTIILDNQKQREAIQALANWDQIDEFLKRK